MARDSDARVARFLSEHPAFADWHTAEIPKDLQNQIESADEQVLMTIITVALHRLGWPAHAAVNDYFTCNSDKRIT